MLKFEVKNQRLTRLDKFGAAEDSVNYLMAHFDFLTDDWDGATITATFSNGEKTVDAVLIENRCKVPWEILVRPVLAKVALFGVKGEKIITTDVCTFSIAATLERGSSGEDPTPDAYQQIINMIEAGKVKGPQGDPGPKGDPGPQGEPGQDGHTPVKGVDYWTASDKQEIYAEAEQALRDQEQSIVAAIKTAGAAEVGKVQAKGTEVLASIPDDYLALVQEVDEQKSDVSALKSDLESKVGDVKTTETEINKTIENGVVSGNVGSIITVGEQTYWKHTVIDVEPYSTYRVTGYTMPNAGIVGYWYLTDDNGTIIRKDSTATEEQILYDMIVKPINGETKLYVLSSSSDIHIYRITSINLQSQIDGLTPKVSQNVEDIEALKNTVGTAPLSIVTDMSKEEMLATYEYGYVKGNVGDVVTIGTQTYWYHWKVSVVNIELLRCGIQIVSNAAITSHISFVDENDVIISKEIPGTETGGFSEIELSIPKGAKYAYINSAPMDRNGYYINTFELCSLSNLIDRNQKSIDTINNSFHPIPSYYTDEWFKNIYSKIREGSNFVNGVVFAFITDLHFGANQLNSKYLLKEVLDNTVTPFVIFGGDYPMAYGAKETLDSDIETLMSYASYIGKDRFASVRGNHDFTIKFSSDSSDGYSMPYPNTYNAISRVSENWVKHINTEHMCFYIENEAQKTRIICLNSSDGDSVEDVGWSVPYRVSAEQITWLLDDAMNCDGYRFIFISHIPSDSAIRSYSDTQQVLQNIFVALKNKTSVVVNGRTVDFTSSTNEAICHITGHNHRDLSNIDNNFLSISTACDALYQDDGHGGVAGTTTEQAFDVFCIDYDSGTIKSVRVGRGNDRMWSY